MVNCSKHFKGCLHAKGFGRITNIRTLWEGGRCLQHFLSYLESY